MFKLPKLPRADLPRIAAWVNVLRDVAALLFIPAVCLWAAGLVYLMRDFAIMGPPDTRLAVVNHFGYALYGLIGVIALGSLWYQKREINASGTTPGGAGFNLNVGNDEPTTTVETTTKVEVS